MRKNISRLIRWKRNHDPQPQGICVLLTARGSVLLNGVYKLRAKADFLKITKRSSKVEWEKRKKRKEVPGTAGVFGGKEKDVS